MMKKGPSSSRAVPFFVARRCPDLALAVWFFYHPGGSQGDPPHRRRDGTMRREMLNQALVYGLVTFIVTLVFPIIGYLS